jgi:NTE family protein
MAKRALVISGGGSRGAFAVGVLSALKVQFPNFSFDVLVGTSTGSLIVPLAAQQRLDLLLQLYTTVHTKDIVLGGNLAARLLNDISLFDASPLGRLIEKFYDDPFCTALFGSGKEVFICTTCLQTSETVVFCTQNPPQSTHQILHLNNFGEFRRSVFASACQPVFMQPVEVILGQRPLMQFVDGGVREIIGIQIAIDAGADEIFAISLSHPDPGNDGKDYEKAIDILLKTLDIYSLDVGTNNVKMPLLYAQALAYIDEVKQKMAASGIPANQINGFFDIPDYSLFQRAPVKIRLIYPNAPLGGGEGGLQFDPNEMKGMVAKGQEQMNEFIASLPPGDNPFA